jgi:hypothetical protein
VVVGINGGTVGGAQVVAGTELLTSAACGGVAACEAVGYNAAGQGVVVGVANGVPGPARVVPGTFELDGIACADAVSCEAVGSNSANQGVVVAIVHGIPGAAHVVAAAEVLDGVACPDASTCRAVGFSASRPQRGLVVSTGAGNPGMARIVPGTSTLRGVACRSAADCEAVGSSSSPVSSSGRVVPVTDGTPGAAQAIPASRDTRFPPPGETALRGVACVRSAPVCAAVGAGDDHSDSSLRGVLATITTPVAFSCGTVVTGSHSGTLVVRAGSTCLTSARLNGSVSVEPGAVLHVTSSTITGSITAHAPGGVRLCRAHVGRSVSVSGATGPVVIGDPGRGSCAGNWIGGSLRLSNNTHGVRARGNHING